jgi:hypothetical protein
MFVAVVAVIWINLAACEVIERIAFGSCYNPLQRGPVDNIWESIEKQQPNRLILLGDTIYADKRTMMFKFTRGNPTSISELYQRFLQSEKWQSLEQSLTRGNEPLELLSCLLTYIDCYRAE